MNKFAVFDIDGTLFRSGLYRELVFELDRVGAIPKSVRQAYEDKKQAWHDRTHGNAFREFEQAMVDALNAIIPSIDVQAYDAAAKLIVKAQKNNVYFYTRTMVQKLKERGYYLIAISGSQIELIEQFAPFYGFDHWVGQEYERNNGVFTGSIFETHTNKDRLLKKLIEEKDLTLADSYGFGDSSGDISMLELVENPIAFNPDKPLAKHAQTSGWDIVVERKNNTYSLRNDGDGYVLADVIYN